MAVVVRTRRDGKGAAKAASSHASVGTRGTARRTPLSPAAAARAPIISPARPSGFTAAAAGTGALYLGRTAPFSCTRGLSSLGGRDRGATGGSGIPPSRCNADPAGRGEAPDALRPP